LVDLSTNVQSHTDLIITLSNNNISFPSMLSYLTNRHYHLLNKDLPDELKAEQPQVVYLPTHNTAVKKPQ